MCVQPGLIRHCQDIVNIILDTLNQTRVSRRYTVRLVARSARDTWCEGDAIAF